VLQLHGVKPIRRLYWRIGISMKNGLFSEKNFRQILENQGEEYYSASKESGSNEGMRKLKEYAKNAKNILECGCGSGRSIGFIWHKNAFITGIDLFEYTLKKAKTDFKNKKNVSFKLGNIENLPFANESYDLVYSTYTMEHVLNPEKAIDEMIRVVKKGGYIIVIAPNYGSPIEFSPCFPMIGYKPITHALKLFFLSHYYLIIPPRKLHWTKVYPLILETKSYSTDNDTTVEPYVQTLITYLKQRGIKLIEYSSGLDWKGDNEEKQMNNDKLPLSFKISGGLKKLVKDLGKKGIAPYKYYGGTLFLVGKKQEK